MSTEQRPDAYPLTWPVGWPRAKARDDARYSVEFARARDQLLYELDHMEGVLTGTIVISSNVPLRRDGFPYAGTPEHLDDPGVAVYWQTTRRGETRPFVIACDCWRRVRENLRAVGLTIEAMRMIERTGASTLLERAFQGFLALPANAGMTRHWRSVLGFKDGAQINREQLEQRYHALAQALHPDKKSGDHDSMVELNRAYEVAKQEVA